MKKWDRSLGTSKREQGIITPKAPQNRRSITARTTIYNSPIFAWLRALNKKDEKAARPKPIEVKKLPERVKFSQRLRQIFIRPQRLPQKNMGQ